MTDNYLDKTYNPSEIESRWYKLWEENGYFKPKGHHDPFCIMLPPPNVTGSLHMGHAFQQTLMDTLIRFKRMQGCTTLWQVGTDHAGIATQMVVERQLQGQNISRHDIGREEFVKKIWEWKEVSGNRITQQLRRIGASVDWSRERFTMDEGLSESVRTVFIRLYEEGLIYRGKRLVNWDPTLLTAVSDLEVVNSEEDGFLWHINYPLVNGEGFLTVATTRPETLFGDVAVAVHPDDERYRHLIGQKLHLPLTDKTIPILADSFVDKEFGTGCVKITPAHDFNDYTVGERHNLTPVMIFTASATLNENVPAPYQGLDRFIARNEVVKALDAAGLLAKTENYKITIPRGDRSGSVLEPYLTNQWYVKVGPLAEPAIEAVESGRIRFIPENWANTYYAWMRNLQDWCISRQLWWGHRIPAWYDDQNNIYVAKNEEAVRKKYALSDNVKLYQDEDVLDTWFSSALWPFSTLGWPEKTVDFQRFYPTSVLVTGFDIIFFWVARMIMMGLKFTGKVPFKEVYIHGLIRDNQGQKMSKSKGNVLDPLDLIDGIDLESLLKKRTSDLMQPQKAKQIIEATRKQFPDGIAAFGTDALRFTFCSLASTGRNIQFEMSRIEGYRNFCNKIWNATRYVLMNTVDKDSSLGDEPIVFSIADRWIVSLLQHAIAQVTEHLTHYRFDLAAQTLYDFIWYAYCDWYLELSKPILQTQQDTPLCRGTRQTMLEVLETTLRLAHPFIPFLTEEIWQKIAPLCGVQQINSISLAAFPTANNALIDKAAQQEVEWLKSFIVSVRTIRSEMAISPAKQLAILCRHGSSSDKSRIDEHALFLSTLARVERIDWLKDDAMIPPAATGLVGDLEILIPLAGLIEPAAELARLQKEITKLHNERQKLQAQLDNSAYVLKAPPQLIDKLRQRVAEIDHMHTTLQQKLVQVERMVENP